MGERPKSAFEAVLKNLTFLRILVVLLNRLPILGMGIQIEVELYQDKINHLNLDQHRVVLFFPFGAPSLDAVHPPPSPLLCMDWYKAHTIGATAFPFSTLPSGKTAADWAAETRDTAGAAFHSSST